MKHIIKHVTDKNNFKRALKISLVVGTILALINHLDAIILLNFSLVNTFQILLTYLVPFSVSTYSSAMQAKHSKEKNKVNIKVT